jgi:hypothetical protein
MILAPVQLSAQKLPSNRGASWLAETEAHKPRQGLPGPAQALNDVITGRVPVMIQTILPIAGVVASGENAPGCAAVCARRDREIDCR